MARGSKKPRAHPCAFLSLLLPNWQEVLLERLLQTRKQNPSANVFDKDFQSQFIFLGSHLRNSVPSPLYGLVMECVCHALWRVACLLGAEEFGKILFCCSDFRLTQERCYGIVIAVSPGFREISPQMLQLKAFSGPSQCAASRRFAIPNWPYIQLRNIR